MLKNHPYYVTIKNSINNILLKLELSLRNIRLIIKKEKITNRKLHNIVVLFVLHIIFELNQLCENNDMYTIVSKSISCPVFHESECIACTYTCLLSGEVTLVSVSVCCWTLLNPAGCEERESVSRVSDPVYTIYTDEDSFIITQLSYYNEPHVYEE